MKKKFLINVKEPLESSFALLYKVSFLPFLYIKSPNHSSRLQTHFNKVEEHLFCIHLKELSTKKALAAPSGGNKVQN